MSRGQDLTNDSINRKRFIPERESLFTRKPETSFKQCHDRPAVVFLDKGNYLATVPAKVRIAEWRREQVANDEPSKRVEACEFVEHEYRIRPDDSQLDSRLSRHLLPDLGT